MHDFDVTRIIETKIANICDELKQKERTLESLSAELTKAKEKLVAEIEELKRKKSKLESK